MKIGELVQLLSAYPPEMEISVAVPYRDKSPIVELRDILVYETKEFFETILQVREPNRAQAIGEKHLTVDERQRVRHEILDGLMDVNRIEKWATRKFTSVHGGFRIYHDFGGSQDTCYGTTYDPRIVKDLENEGLILKESFAPCYGCSYRITNAGKAALSAEVAKAC